jgi:uncharacterized membrane protein
MNGPLNRRPLLAAGTLLGIGLGGFVDGIVFHQILQLHNMLSSWLPPTSVANLEINMVWDGLFHAFCWIATVVGLGLLWRALTRPDVPRQGAVFLGAMLLGWGLFNLVEGLIDHQILQVHHVHERGSHLLWDLVFLGSGAALIGLGAGLIHQAAVTADETAGAAA